MAEECAQRRLAAIMAADVVGYSRLIEQHEAGTLAALRDRRRTVLTPLVTRHHGRIVKVMGDGVLVEFGSAVNAVVCAAGMGRGGPGRPAAEISIPIAGRVARTTFADCRSHISRIAFIDGRPARGQDASRSPDVRQVLARPLPEVVIAKRKLFPISASPTDCPALSSARTPSRSAA